MNRAVFLDRDGVLNHAVVAGGKPYPPAGLTDFALLPGVREACRNLADAGFLLIVATNQPDVAAGRQRRDIVEAMHDRLMEWLPLQEIRVCWDLESPDSRCYKPKPGMLLDAAARWDIDLRHSYMVGDRWRDVGCGQAAGCFTILVDYGYPETAEKLTAPPDATCRSLAEAAIMILGRSPPAES